MLTLEDRERLARAGVTVVSGLVRPDLVVEARDAVCAAIGAEYTRPESWYAHEPLDWSVVPVHHAPVFWQVRQEPALHACFASLLGTEKLWVSLDRAAFKVPASPAHPLHLDASILHWDLDPRGAAGGVFQGMLYLTDTGAGEGAFECVPSIFRNLDAYLASHAGPLVEVPVDLGDHAVVQVPARAGDLVVWSALLPHHGGKNRGVRPRVSMAVTMFPEGSDDEREERVRCFHGQRAPAWWRGWKGQRDPEEHPPRALTSLGRKLVGIDRW
jgi:hypothetical protein